MDDFILVVYIGAACNYWPCIVLQIGTVNWEPCYGRIAYQCRMEAIIGALWLLAVYFEFVVRYIIIVCFFGSGMPFCSHLPYTVCIKKTD